MTNESNDPRSAATGPAVNGSTVSGAAAHRGVDAPTPDGWDDDATSVSDRDGVTPDDDMEGMTDLGIPGLRVPIDAVLAADADDEFADVAPPASADPSPPSASPPSSEPVAPSPEPVAPSLAGLLTPVPVSTVQAPAVAAAHPTTGIRSRRDPDLLAAPERASARRATRRNVLIASIGFVVLGVVFLVLARPTHTPIAVPIVLVVAGLLGAALSFVLQRAASSDLDPEDRGGTDGS